MKQLEHIQKAKEIGADSWGLINFGSLPYNASAAKQVEALRADMRWMQEHMTEIVHRIEHLIRKIEDQ